MKYSVIVDRSPYHMRENGMSFKNAKDRFLSLCLAYDNEFSKLSDEEVEETLKNGKYFIGDGQISIEVCE